MSAYAHQLFLDIPTVSNSEILRITDASIYTSKLPINCATLQITCPGFNIPTTINVIRDFNTAFNACTLGLQVEDCGNTSDVLPDGIYIIRYSVSPNDQVYVEYNHLRITQFLNNYYEKMSDLELSACEPSADVKNQLNELRLIKSFIDAAKAKVEYSHENKEAMDILKYAQKRLLKLDCKQCNY